MHRLSRRRVLIGGVALAAVIAGAPSPAVATPPPVVTDEVRLAGLEQANNALIGVYAVNLDTGKTVTHRAADTFPMLSTFKTYAAARILEMAERGELTLEDKLFVDPAAILLNSPITQERAGGEMTLSELCQAVLQRSDNAAANILLQRMGGPQAITDFARSIGDNRSRLDRWEIELNSAIPGDPRDTSTPEAIGAGYRALLAGDALAPAQRRLLDDWMRANQTSSMRAGFPPGWTSADKTGSGDYGTANDVGIAYGPAGERLLLAVMTRSAGNHPEAQNLRPVVGQVAELLIGSLTA